VRHLLLGGLRWGSLEGGEWFEEEDQKDDQKEEQKEAIFLLF
jgi:hypothetical protein